MTTNEALRYEAGSDQRGAAQVIAPAPNAKVKLSDVFEALCRVLRISVEVRVFTS